MIFAAFDIGNVLCRFDIFKFTKKLAQVANISENDAYFVLDHIQHMQDIGVTKVSHALRYRFHNMSDDSIQELMDCWNNTISQCDSMMNFLEVLRHEGV